MVNNHIEVVMVEATGHMEVVMAVVVMTQVNIQLKFDI
jgi:hypothetical protein